VKKAPTGDEKNEGNIFKQTLSIAISDKGNPPLKRLQEIAAALGVEVVDLLVKPSAGNFVCPNCGASLRLNAEKV
jgi:transcriptional regulator with XRE-family HTH domain